MLFELDRWHRPARDVERARWFQRLELELALWGLFLDERRPSSYRRPLEAVTFMRTVQSLLLLRLR